jgi:hypothetical protein
MRLTICEFRSLTAVKLIENSDSQKRSIIIQDSINDRHLVLCVLIQSHMLYDTWYVLLKAKLHMPWISVLKV